ncbi:MAG: glutathione synthase, partial [Myxococcales bacterium]
ELTRTPGAHFRVLRTEELPVGALDVLFMRKDPPVDVDFLHATQLVELVRGRRPVYVNAPSGMRSANEKLWALQFPQLCPETLVSRDPEALKAFVRRQPHGAVLKPVDGFGGRGVLRAAPGDLNLNALVEVSTAAGTAWVVAQRFVPESAGGDKRILLVGGEPVGAVLRVPSGDDFRCNMAMGGSAEQTGLGARDLEICRALGPELVRLGLEFVGIDVIGEHLIEVNVTSPTGLEEAERLGTPGAAARVLARVEELARDRAPRA